MVFDDALRELYQAPHAEFIATRKRLAGELSAEGDVTGAARLVKLNRPPLSAWVVNQLWWGARPTFEQLIKTAARLRDGDSKAGNPYRDAMAKLRAHAEALLHDAGHPASDQTLRRVTTTVAAIAATGDFGPDEPGVLTGDREPPGVEHGEVTVTVRANRIPGSPEMMMGDDDEPAPAPSRTKTLRQPPPMPPPKPKGRVTNGRVHPHVEMHSDDDVLTSVVTTQALLESALSTARKQIEASELEREQLQRRLSEVEHAIAQARTIVADCESRLGNDDPTSQ